MTDNQERENFYHNSSNHKGFIFAVSLLNDLTCWSIVLFLKDLGSDCYCKNSIS